MADLVALTTGNFTAAGTWGLVDAASKLISTNTGSTALTTGTLDSATFTPGAITVIGVVLHLARRDAGTPTNTLTVRLRQSVAAIDIATVVVNVSDLPVSATGGSSEGGYHFFKFSAPVVLLAATTYVIRLQLSATTTPVSIATNGTANNWQRLLVTGTTQAPAAADDLYLAQPFDGVASPATPGTLVVTMDSTTATDYGVSVNGYTPALSVSKGCTLAYGAVAATSYILRLSGWMGVYREGTFTMGTVVTPCPRDSTMVLEFDCPSDGAFGLGVKAGGTVIAQGQSRTAGKSVIQCKLAANASAGATTLTVDTDTGWKNGDVIAIASTSTTYTQHEQRTLTADAGTSTLDVAALTNAHGGTAPVTAEIILLTHQVKIRSVSSTFMSSVYLEGTVTIDFDWVEFQYLGSSAMEGIHGDISATATFSVRYCSFRNSDAATFYIQSATHTGWTVEDVVIYATLTTSAFRIFATSGSGWTLRRCTVMGCGNTTGSYGFSIEDMNGTMSDLTVTSCNYGAGLALADAAARNWTVNNIVVHSCNTTMSGIAADLNIGYGTISNFTLWRGGGSGRGGIRLGGGAKQQNLTFRNGRIFGWANTAIYFDAGLLCNFLFDSVHTSGDTSAPSNGAIYWGNDAAAIPAYVNMRFENCTFGVATGIYVAHSSQDMSIGGTGSGAYIAANFVNCIFASAVEFNATQNLMLPTSYIASQQHDQTVNHKVWTPTGTMTYETTTVDVSPSLKITPLSATAKIESNASLGGRGFLVAFDSGQSIDVSVKVQKDASYNGNPPRLIQKANPGIGVNADVVLDTHSAAAGSFETLTGTTAAATADGVAEFVVDADGTVGNCYVDTWTAA